MKKEEKGQQTSKSQIKDWNDLEFETETQNPRLKTKAQNSNPKL
jgi:hypothetical protein